MSKDPWCRRLCGWTSLVALLATLHWVAPREVFQIEAVALAQPTGQPLRELTGRRIGPGDDPRARARLRREARGIHELRRRSSSRYRWKRLPGGGWQLLSKGWKARVAPDGSVTFGKRSLYWSTRKMQLSFDVTDAVMRARKMDPYAAAKLRFMRETAAWRWKLRQEAARRARRRFLELLPARLSRLWGRRDISTMRKRALLFELWEECLEPGPGADAALAQQARWVIIRFIRRNLPATSSRAYTRRELLWMGRLRRGKTPFDPYGPAGRRPLLPSVDRQP